MGQNVVVSDKIMWSDKKLFRTVVGGNTRIIIYAINVLTALFLTIYSQIIGIGNVAFSEELRNMVFSIIGVVFIRELFFLLPLLGKGEKTSARRAYVLSVFSWILGGGIAIGIQYALYRNDFSVYNIFSTLLEYWIIGGGLIAQLEYGVYEHKLEVLPVKSRDGKVFLGSLTRRFLESTIIFISISVLTMLLVVYHASLNNGVVSTIVIKELMYMGVVFLIVGLSITLLFGLSFVKNARIIIKALAALKEGKLDVEIDSTRLDELGKISSCVHAVIQELNKMKKQMQEVFQKLGNPPEIAQYINEECYSCLSFGVVAGSTGSEEGRQYSCLSYGRFADKSMTREFNKMNTKSDLMEGEERNIAILMCDIRGFTRLSSTMTPQEITSMLNRYFSEMVMVIQEEGGLVDKFIGDAIMAVFGLVGDKDSCIQSVRAALGMRAVLAMLNEQIGKEGKYQEINNGIGVHYGNVVAGYIGSKERLEYTVIGSAVNIASRLCDIARPPRPPIVVSEKIAQVVQGIFNISVIGNANIKGIGDTKLFTVSQQQV